MLLAVIERLKLNCGSEPTLIVSSLHEAVLGNMFLLLEL